MQELVTIFVNVSCVENILIIEKTKVETSMYKHGQYTYQVCYCEGCYKDVIEEIIKYSE